MSILEIENIGQNVILSFCTLKYVNVRSYFPTVCSYMAKGYPASYLTDFWLGDVWGKEFMSFNGEKEGKFKALTKPKGMSRCMMYIGWKKLGTLKVLVLFILLQNMLIY